MQSEQAQHVVQAASPGGRSGGWQRRVAQVLPPFALLSALVAAWEVIVWRLALPAWLLPPPSRILTTLMNNLPVLGEHIAATLSVTAPGFGLALIGGFALGVLIDTSPFLRRAVYPLLVTHRRSRLWQSLLCSWWDLGLACCPRCWSSHW